MTLDQFNQAEVVGAKLGDAFNELYLLSNISPRGEASPNDRPRLEAVLIDIRAAEAAMVKLFMLIRLPHTNAETH